MTEKQRFPVTSDLFECVAAKSRGTLQYVIGRKLLVGKAAPIAGVAPVACRQLTRDVEDLEIDAGDGWMLSEDGDDSSHRVGCRKENIVVERDDDLAARHGDPFIATTAAAVGWQLDDMDLWEGLPDHGDAAVGRAVVDDHDFEVGVFLLHGTPNHLLEDLSTLVCQDDDADGRALHQFGSFWRSRGPKRLAKGRGSFCHSAVWRE